jgi:Raf kinase inhibitor-like YbhB/YbcL family protein
MSRTMRRYLGSALAAALLTACENGADRPAEQGTADAPGPIAVTSPAFADGAEIPQQYTCHGAGTSPPLEWTGVPPGSASIAVVVDDPDAPSGTFVHWVLVGLPADQGHLAEGAVPSGAHQARNSGGGLGWTPPCPPSGTHHYRFTVYAMGREPDVPDDAAPDAAVRAVEQAAIAQGTLTGTVSAG